MVHDLRMRTRALLLASVAGLTVLALSACSSSSSSSSSATSAAPAPVGTSAATWTPLDITQAANGTTLAMVVDQVGVFTETPQDTGWEIQTSDPAIVAVEQAEGSGTVTASPAIIAKAPGTAKITMLYPDQPADQGGASNIVMEFTVEVSAP